MKASILAIGTELTTGQIINKNAATLSQKLKSLGIVISSHVTVPDDKKLILEALEFVNNKSDLIFITGGLGPTSDDFTRDVVAEWCGLKTKFDETSWQHVQERLSSRGFKVRDMQKQQCYFPENSKILSNSEGTAHGFKINHLETNIYVLPGPPREIEAIWKSHIQNELIEKTKHLNKLKTLSWDTIGVGESEVAFQVEEILAHRPRELHLDIGYRVHLPYVEVKMTFNEQDENTWKVFIDLIESGLKPITVSRNFADVVQILTEKIQDLDFTFYDFVSDGYLHTRLSPKLKKLKNWSFKQSENILSVDFFENEDQFLALLPFEDDKCLVVFSIDGQFVQKTIEAPMKSSLMSERRMQYFAEMALVEICRVYTK